jgi:hypothetical protein
MESESYHGEAETELLGFRTSEALPGHPNAHQSTESKGENTLILLKCFESH